MFTVKSKIIIAITIVVGLVFYLFGLFIYQQVRSADLEKVDVRLESLAQKVRNEIDEQLERNTFPKIDELQIVVSENLPSSLFRLFDSSGNVIYSDSVLMKSKLHSIAEIKGKRIFVEKIRIAHARYRSLWYPVEIEEHHGWLLQIATPLSGMEEDLDQLELILWTTIPFALLVTLVAVYLIVRRALKPLSTMIENANRISASNLNERLIVPQKRDEVSVLGNAINRMIGRIEAAFTNQKQFIADASHEIRTPLTIIQSELEFATRSPLADSARNSIQIALDELDHLRKLAGDLLLLAKMEISDAALRFNTIRLDELLAECVQKLTRTSVEKNVAVQLRIEQPVELSADEEKLRSALLNCIENAIKYTPANGTVTLTLNSDSLAARIAIADTGVGISPDDIGNIFKPFYRSDISRATHGGSGLGLSIVQRIIESHHGTISVESIVNRGSTFSITLPRTQSG